MSACSISRAMPAMRTPPRRTPARAMAPHEYANWLLGNFATVDEVKANFDKVVLVPVVVEAIEQAAPVHFVVHDRSGKAVVIEPLNKGAEDLRQPARRRNQFADLRLAHDQPAQLHQSHRHQCAAGRHRRHQAGAVRPGLGPARIAGRFHAAVAFCARCRVFAIGGAVRHRPAGGACRPSTSSTISTFLYGAVREVDNGQMHAEATVWTSASDLKNLRWYFRTYDDQSIRSVDLTKALAAAHGQIKFIKMSGRQPVTRRFDRFQMRFAANRSHVKRAPYRSEPEPRNRTKKLTCL